MLWSSCWVPGVCPEVGKKGWVTKFSSLVESEDGFQGWFQALGPVLVASKLGIQVGSQEWVPPKVVMDPSQDWVLGNVTVK